MSKLVRGAFVVLAAVAALSFGCSLSETRYPLGMSASEAPNTFGPIRQCAMQRSLKTQDGTNPPRINIWLNDLEEISYTVRDDHFDMDVVLWGKVTPEDKPKVVERVKNQGLEVWTCAQKIGFAPPPPPAVAGPAAVAPPAH